MGTKPSPLCTLVCVFHFRGPPRCDGTRSTRHGWQKVATEPVHGHFITNAVQPWLSLSEKALFQPQGGPVLLLLVTTQSLSLHIGLQHVFVVRKVPVSPQTSWCGKSVDGLHLEVSFVPWIQVATRQWSHHNLAASMLMGLFWRAPNNARKRVHPELSPPLVVLTCVTGDL